MKANIKMLKFAFGFLPVFILFFLAQQGAANEPFEIQLTEGGAVRLLQRVSQIVDKFHEKLWGTDGGHQQKADANAVLHHDDEETAAGGEMFAVLEHFTIPRVSGYPGVDAAFAKIKAELNKLKKLGAALSHQSKQEGTSFLTEAKQARNLFLLRALFELFGSVIGTVDMDKEMAKKAQQMSQICEISTNKEGSCDVKQMCKTMSDKNTANIRAIQASLSQTPYEEDYLHVEQSVIHNKFRVKILKKNEKLEGTEMFVHKVKNDLSVEVKVQYTNDKGQQVFIAVKPGQERILNKYFGIRINIGGSSDFFLLDDDDGWIVTVSQCNGQFECQMLNWYDWSAPAIAGRYNLRLSRYNDQQENTKTWLEFRLHLMEQTEVEWKLAVI